MDFGWVWKSIMIVTVGTALLRVAGRKSIAQMTVAQTVIMIAIGSLLIQPVGDRSIWVTFGVAAILIVTLILMEWIQVHNNSVEKLITGKSKLLVENGNLIEENLRGIRLTVDQLEMQLRQSSVQRISDLEWATMEPNGRIGFMLKPNAQPATRGDIELLISLINQKLPNGGAALTSLPKQPPAEIFDELTGSRSATRPTRLK